MDAATGAILGSLLTAVIGAAVAAAMQLRGQTHKQRREDRADRIDEYEDYIARLERLYEQERAARESADHGHNECQRRLARLEGWVEVAAAQMRDKGIPVPPLSEGSGHHRPVPEGKET